MAKTATDIGKDAGGFIGGVLNPVLGGTTTTTTTQKPTSGSTALKVIGITLAVGALAFVAYIVLKKKGN